MKIKILKSFGAVVLFSACIGLTRGATTFGFIHTKPVFSSTTVASDQPDTEPALRASPQAQTYARLGLVCATHETTLLHEKSSPRQMVVDYDTGITIVFGNLTRSMELMPNREQLRDFFTARHPSADEILVFFCGGEGIVNLAGHDPHTFQGSDIRNGHIRFLSSTELGFLVENSRTWGE